MSFISYAQNFEDVLLWRALQDVQNGFYLDVGANDPVLHSVTKAFYDRGWSGINVEPMPSYGAAFAAQRPRDINLNVAAGAASGSITLFDVPEVNGWASTDGAVAAAHRAHGHSVVEHQVPLLTLSEICRSHVRGPIHFLKIDVEGFEGEVLRGMDFQQFRPWIVVVEAIMPNSRDSNHESWEALLTGQGYQYAWFDGLNRYYVADEQAHLAQRLQLQPNVFDDFIPQHLDQAWQRTAQLEQQAEQAWTMAQEHGVRLEQATRQNAQLDQSLQREHRQRQQDQQLHQQELAQRQQQLQQSHAELQQSRNDLAQRQQQLAQSRAELQQTQQNLRQREQDLQQRHTEMLQLQAGLRQAEGQLQQLDSRLHQVAAWGDDMERRLLAVYASRSWRLTAPLRYLTQRGEASLLKRAQRALRAALRRAVRWLTSRQWLRRTLLPLIGRSPRLSQAVNRTLHVIKQGSGPAAGAADVPQLLRELPQSARRALDDLRRAQPSNKN